MFRGPQKKTKREIRIEGEEPSCAPQQTASSVLLGCAHHGGVTAAATVAAASVAADFVEMAAAAEKHFTHFEGVEHDA